MDDIKPVVDRVCERVPDASETLAAFVARMVSATSRIAQRTSTRLVLQCALSSPHRRHDTC